MFRLRHLEQGQTAAEYVGILAVVVLVIGGVVGATVGTDITEKIGQQVCKIGGGSCGDDGGSGGDQPQAAGQDGSGSNGGNGGEKSPEQAKYDKIQKDLAQAKEDLQSSEDKAIKAAKELGKILADELGITDAFKCITEGDASACTETVLNVLSSLIGGAIGKLAKKYGAPWKWDDAARLIKRIKNHGGDLYDGIKNLIKNRKKVNDLEEAAEDARKKLPDEKPKDPNKPDEPIACGRTHSFLPGTPVILANGSRKPIERVRVGEKVLATNPVTGLTAARAVQRTITTEDDKHFTRLTVPVSAGASGAVTLTATDTHPFWLANRQRWADAAEIRQGDTLRTADGATLPVLRTASFERTHRTHDLTVAGIHTYYVGAGASDALVHNDDPCPEPPKNAAEARQKALDGWQSKQYRVGNESFALDKKAMDHFLKRHHPKYWDGSKKADQTFFDKKMTPDDVANVADQVMKQNRDEVLGKGTNGIYQVEGTVNGVRYKMGLNNGRISQLYPMKE